MISRQTAPAGSRDGWGLGSSEEDACVLRRRWLRGRVLRAGRARAPLFRMEFPGGSASSGSRGEGPPVRTFPRLSAYSDLGTGRGRRARAQRGEWVGSRRWSPVCWAPRRTGSRESTIGVSTDVAVWAAAGQAGAAGKDRNPRAKGDGVLQEGERGRAPVGDKGFQGSTPRPQVTHRPGPEERSEAGAGQGGFEDAVSLPA